jgi:hypothetical protein
MYFLLTGGLRCYLFLAFSGTKLKKIKLLYEKKILIL